MPSKHLFLYTTKFFLFLLVIGVLLLFVQCVRYPYTTLSNAFVPFWKGQGVLPVDSQDDNGGVNIRLTGGEHVVDLSIPVEYLPLKVRPEMESVIIAIDYESLDPVAYKQGRSSKAITVQIHLGQDHMEEINENDFKIFLNHNMLSNVADNMWKLRLENSYVWRQHIRALGVRASRYHWIGGGNYIFYLTEGGDVLLASCPALCGIRSNINKAFYATYSLQEAEIGNLDRINAQIEKFINKHRKE